MKNIGTELSLNDARPVREFLEVSVLVVVEDRVEVVELGVGDLTEMLNSRKPGMQLLHSPNATPHYQYTNLLSTVYTLVQYITLR